MNCSNIIFLFFFEISTLLIIKILLYLVFFCIKMDFLIVNCIGITNLNDPNRVLLPYLLWSWSIHSFQPSYSSKCVFTALWVMNYFLPSNPFLTDKTPNISRYHHQYSNVLHTFVPSVQLRAAMPQTQWQIILIPFVIYYQVERSTRAASS